MNYLVRAYSLSICVLQCVWAVSSVSQGICNWFALSIAAGPRLRQKYTCRRFQQLAAVGGSLIYISMTRIYCQCPGAVITVTYSWLLLGWGCAINAYTLRLYIKPYPPLRNNSKRELLCRRCPLKGFIGDYPELRLKVIRLAWLHQLATFSRSGGNGLSYLILTFLWKIREYILESLWSDWMIGMSYLPW